VVQQLMQYFLSDAVQGNLTFFGASPVPPAYVSSAPAAAWPPALPALPMSLLLLTCANAVPACTQY
jgi:hypothetical protein